MSWGVAPITGYAAGMAISTTAAATSAASEEAILTFAQANIGDDR